MLHSTDVFVIGGGPAGLAAAIALRQRGLRVIVADGAQPPIDKACGEGLLPDGLAALERLGLALPVAESHPFLGIRFLSGRLFADAQFPDGGFGLSARRPVLHRVMVERAAQLGTDLWWGAPVTGISGEGVFVGENLVRARWIIGADGSNSRVRRWAGLDAGARPRLRYAYRQHFRVTPWSDHMEVYWGDACQGYATAVDGEQVCVAVASHRQDLRLHEGLRELPELNARLRGAESTSAERGAITGNRVLRGVCGGNVALIGDASGTVDAITGEGLGLAFSQAISLAHGIVAGDLASYQVEHRRLARRPVWMARLMLMLEGRPRLQKRTLQVFRRRPHVFRSLLELHVGARSPFNVALDGLTLGWGLLTA